MAEVGIVAAMESFGTYRLQVWEFNSTPSRRWALIASDCFLPAHQWPRWRRHAAALEKLRAHLSDKEMAELARLEVFSLHDPEYWEIRREWARLAQLG